MAYFRAQATMYSTGSSPSAIAHVAISRGHMATRFELTVSCPRFRATVARRVLEEAHQQIAQLEAELSEFLPSSPISRLNRAPVGKRVPIGPSAVDLLERCHQLREQTGGAFDCLAKSLGPFQRPPEVAWDRSSAWRITPETHIGFGAIGKGYALDRVRTCLEREGFSDYLLVAGGSSIVMSGFAAPGEPWRWAWSWSRDAMGRPLGIGFTHITGDPVAIGVSGTQERGNHLIDPRTRRPVTDRVSALVGCGSAAEADALSTALFVMGWSDGGARVAQLLTHPALGIIEPGDQAYWNPRFEQWWGPCA